MRVLIAAVIMVLLTSSTVMACSCPEPTEDQAKAAYADTEVIVRARIIQVSGGWGTMTPIMRLEVIEKLKGDNIPTVMMANYNNNMAACGYDYQEGDEDIIALYDTRDIGLTDNNSRGYGFRVMSSCHAEAVKYFINTILQTE